VTTPPLQLEAANNTQQPGANMKPTSDETPTPNTKLKLKLNAQKVT